MLARDIDHDDSGGGQDGDATGGCDSSGGDDNDPVLDGGGSSGIAGDARSRGRRDTTAVGDKGDEANHGGGGGGGGTVPSAADATRSFSSPKQRKAWLRNLKYRQQKQAARTRQQPFNNNRNFWASGPSVGTPDLAPCLVSPACIPLVRKSY